MFRKAQTDALDISAADASPLEEEISAERVRLLYRQSRPGLIGSIGVAAVLTMALWEATNQRWLLIWAASLMFVTFARLVLVTTFLRRDPSPATFPRWCVAHTTGAFFGGTAWGSATWLLLVTPSLVHQLIIVLAIGGMAVGSLSANSGSLRVYFAFFVPAIAPLMLYYSTHGGVAGIETVVLTLLFSGIVILTAYHYNRSITATLRMRQENRGLVWTLSASNQELARSNENTGVLHRLSQLDVDSAPLEQRLKAAIETVCSVSWIHFSQTGAIFFADEESRQLSLAANWNLPTELRERCVRVGYDTGLCGKTASTREIQLSGCVDERCDVHYDSMENRGHYGIPILSGEILLGVLVLYVNHGYRSSGSESEFLEAVAASLAGTIERCRADDELGLAARVFDNSLEGIVITDPQGNILKTNPAASVITGFRQDEMAGRTLRLWRSGHHEPAFYKALWQSLIDTGRWQGEIWNRRKSGEVYPIWQTIVTVHNRRNEPVGYIGIFSDISERKRAEDQLRRLAYFDALTDLPNRRVFEDRLDQAVERARRHSTRFAVVFVDLYRFRAINDSLGYRIGDEILKITAARLRATVRREDTVARVGGDAFGIILDEIGDAQAAETVVHKIVSAVNAPLSPGDGDLTPSCSVGIGIYPDDGLEARALLTNTDAALRQAELQGENRHSFYSARMAQEAAARLTMERALRRAIDRDELVLYFQPQFSGRLGRIVGAEALVRWQHPSLGLLAPARFIPLAEETRLIVPLSRWVLQRAVSQWADLNEGREPRLRVGINISPHQFQEPDFVSSVSDALRASGMPPDRLELEITETVLVQDAAAVVPRLQRLKDLGVRIAIDDFGTGYSSLSYLATLPIDTVKIDRAFVRKLVSDTASAALVRAILQMCRALDMEVIAEGVETIPQFAMLREMGVDNIQGYLFSKPVPCDVFNQLPSALHPSPGKRPEGAERTHGFETNALPRM
jgi:diguanylate cyclase (GGDEF)-like protein/PAS domain S-box-containing protein